MANLKTINYMPDGRPISTVNILAITVRLLVGQLGKYTPAKIYFFHFLRLRKYEPVNPVLMTDLGTFLVELPNKLTTFLDCVMWPGTKTRR